MLAHGHIYVLLSEYSMATPAFKGYFVLNADKDLVLDALQLPMFSFVSLSDICWSSQIFSVCFVILNIDSFLPVTEDFACAFCLVKCGSYKVKFEANFHLFYIYSNVVYCY